MLFIINAKNMVITEKKIAEKITEAIEKSDLKKYVKDDKDFEKRVREITSEVVKDMFRVLWQHNTIFNTLAKK